MAALTTGTLAPHFKLATTDGRTLSLRDMLSRAPVVLAFFKISCPTCQYTFPFLERIHQAYGGKFQIVGISQNNKKDTEAFMKEYGVTFPVLLDDTKTYPISNAYGLTNVPTIFWIGQTGTIELASVGWVKQDIDDLNRKAAENLHQVFAPIFDSNESVADFRAG